jgi:hypothetical protein
MPKETDITDDFSFIDGALRSRDRAYLLTVKDELAEKKEPYGLFFTWTAGKWGQQNVKWAAVSLCVARTPKEQMVSIGEWGDVMVLGSGEMGEEEIKDGEQYPEERGTMRCVRAIEGVPYAAGLHRQVYRREGKKKWKCIDASMRPKDSEDVVGFESIDGFSEKDIYAVGWDGCIWHYNGKKWREIDSPTNLILTNVCCAPDGVVYACGQEGVLLRGRDDKWELLDHGKKQNFFGLAWYRNELYVASDMVVFTLKKNKLKPVQFEDDLPETAYRLSAADGVLWSVGAKDVLAFDGKKWTRIA